MTVQELVARFPEINRAGGGKKAMREGSVRLLDMYRPKEHGAGD